MAQTTFRCKLITPEAKVLDGPATAAVIPVWDGSMGILANRAALVAKLGIGELRLDLTEKGGSRAFVVEGGFAHMVHNELTILASKATAAEDINEAEAQAEVAEAEARRTEGVSDPAELQRIRSALDRARHRLTAVRSIKARAK